VTSPPQKWSRIVSAVAMLSLWPTLLFVEAEAAARQARSGFESQATKLETMLAEFHQRPISCRPASSDGRLLIGDIMELISDALDATRAVNRAFRSDTPFWSSKKGLPWTSGLFSFYQASISTQADLARLEWNLGLCHRVRDLDDARLREEEQHSQARLDEHSAKLEGLFDHLKAGKEAYERDRPKLTAAAWSLGLFQVVGWGLLCLVVLPNDIRAWRARRSEMKKDRGAT
jgi:hypothetical protein